MPTLPTIRIVTQTQARKAIWCMQMSRMKTVEVVYGIIYVDVNPLIRYVVDFHIGYRQAIRFSSDLNRA